MAEPAAVTWADVAKHSSEGDCWIAVDGTVYDVSGFLERHPGGKAVLLGVAGRDATSSFRAVHQPSILALVKNKVVGRVVGAGPAAAAAAAADDDVPDRPHPESVAPPGALGRIRDAALTATGDVLGLTTRAIYGLGIRPLEVLQRTFMPIRPLQPGTADKPVKVAVVGGGCGGLTAAWALVNTGGFDVTVLEAAENVGGHAFTYPYAGSDGTKVPVDMGFIFGAHRSYSNMLNVMKEVGSEPVHTELSLSVDIDGTRWATDGTVCDGMKGPTKMDPRGLKECDRFHDICERWWGNSAFNMIPFGWVLSAYGFSQEFKDLYVTPTLITLFISKQSLYAMSARFMFNMFGGPNKFVDLRKGWGCFTVAQGTNPGWIQRLAAGFRDSIRTSAKVSAVRRVQEAGQSRVIVEWEEKSGKQVGLFDHVLIACGGKVADQILCNKTALERLFFAQVRYEGEHVVLHNDSSFMPRDKSIWRNFNYKDRKGQDLPELTGTMAHVARVDPSSEPPILTMNPKRQPKKVLHERYCAVHVQDMRHMFATRLLLPAIEGNGNVWLCGSWCNYLGHSGAVDAGLVAATSIGANYPLTDPVARDEFYVNACYDMLGPRFIAEEAIRRFEAAKKAKGKAKL